MFYIRRRLKVGGSFFSTASLGEGLFNHDCRDRKNGLITVADIDICTIFPHALFRKCQPFKFSGDLD